MSTITPQDVLAISEMAKTWSTVQEVADRYGVPLRSINRAINHGQVIAWKTNVNRVDPTSLTAWLAARQT